MAWRDVARCAAASQTNTPRADMDMAVGKAKAAKNRPIGRSIDPPIHNTHMQSVKP